MHQYFQQFNLVAVVVVVLLSRILEAKKAFLINNQSEVQTFLGLRLWDYQDLVLQ
jgi:hypothetical protein